LEPLFYLFISPLYGVWGTALLIGLRLTQVNNSGWQGVGSSYSLELSVLLFLLFITLLVSIPSLRGEGFLFSSVILLSLLFFKTGSLLLLYTAFEASLIPISCIILFWGYQPERVSASFYLLVYGLTRGLPLASFLFREKQEELLTVSNFHPSTSLFWVATFGFLVKTPLFFFHHWLPKAHVEAPTLGRVLLAGVLLKQGTYGTVIILNLFQHYYSGIFLYLRFLGAGFMPLAVAAATDIKAWVALSSVVHINALVTGLLTFSRVSKTNSILIILFHGVTSRGMFLIAGGLIHRFNTRRFYSIQGCSSIEQVIFLLFLFCNMGVPPFARFLREFLHYAVLTSFIGGLGFLWILNFVGVFYYCLFVSQVINKLPGTFTSQRMGRSRLVLGLICAAVLNLRTLSWVF